VTLEEKRIAIIAECLACLKHICENANNLNNAKWLDAAALATSNTISQEGRVPTSQESIEWIKRQGWAFLN
jgi:hypothetical protein